jgi:hypothetical protein
MFEAGHEEFWEGKGIVDIYRAMRDLLRWWEPGTAEPFGISHWGIVE